MTQPLPHAAEAAGRGSKGGLALDHPLKPYFDALDVGDVEALAECFAEDGVYIHPPWDPAKQNRLFAVAGKAALRDYFAKRGKQPQHHRILFAAVNGSSCFIEGRGGGEGVRLHAFVSHAIFDGEGKIKRYVAFLEYPDREELVDSSIGFDNGEFKAVPEIMLGTGPDVDP